jgi:hypothetical protein
MFANNGLEQTFSLGGTYRRKIVVSVFIYFDLLDTILDEPKSTNPISNMITIVRVGRFVEQILW